MSYTTFDRFAAWCRFRAALPYIREGAFVCDIGCGLDARFLNWLGPRIRGGLGLDYQASSASSRASVVLANITQDLPIKGAQFDHAVMLAVLEHLREPESVLREAHRILVPGGSLIMTWPTAAVDPILHLLHGIGLVSKEMESEKHEQRIPLPTLEAILHGIGFEKLQHRTFELGLNNLLVAHKRG